MTPTICSRLLASSLLALLLTAGCNRQADPAPASAAGQLRLVDSLEGSLQLSGAFALYPLAVRWGEAFEAQHPLVRVSISGGGAGKGITDALSGMVDIGMVSREVYAEEVAKGAFPIAVAIDAVVPTIQASNPEMEAIRRRGITVEEAEGIWRRRYATWGELLDNGSRLPLRIYTRSDACGAAETFASWLGMRQEQLKGIAVYGDPGVAAAVQRDKASIGYNNLAYVYDQRTRRPFEGLAVIPVDLNGDGRISPDEDFYATTDSLVAAVRDGRYPMPPARRLYLVTLHRPTDPLLTAFLDFVLTEGQQYAAETGYIALSDETLRGELARLYNSATP